jgi:predicted HD superfamily hydrolase involved in NAD metabolism
MHSILLFCFTEENTIYMINRIKENLAQKLDQRRYQHSLEVAKEAKKLSQIYGYNEDKAELAGLLHDSAKYLEPKQLLLIAISDGYRVDSFERENPELLHSYVSSMIARDYYSIAAADVLDAIKKHTVGDKEMGLLDKIIFVADYTDINRTFDPEKRHIIKEESCKNLDNAVTMVVKEKLSYVEANHEKIHPKAQSLLDKGSNG